MVASCLSQAAAALLQAAATAATERPGVNSTAIGDSIAFAADAARFALLSTSIDANGAVVNPALSHAGPRA